MKTSILQLFAVLISGFSYSQKKVKVKDQLFEMNVMREGKPVKVENKNSGIKLNYETGEFYAKINIC